MYSDLTVDYLKVTLLNAPAVLLVRSPDGPHLACNCTYPTSCQLHV